MKTTTRRPLAIEPASRPVAGAAPLPEQRNGKEDPTGAGEQLASEILTMRVIQRARILGALSTILEEHGVERASVTKIVTLARVPRGVFYGQFSGRDEALRALVVNALQRTSDRVARAYTPGMDWRPRIRAGLHALLELYEAEPEIGRLCLIHSRHPDPGMAQLRARTLNELTRQIAAGRRDSPEAPGVLSAQCTVAGVLGVLEERLREEHAPLLTPLAAELMSFILLSYRGAAAAFTERTRESGAESAPGRRVAGEAGEPAKLRITYRTMRVLAAIGHRPGLCNLEVAEQAGIDDQGQISKLLKRLQTLGLAENTGAGAKLGSKNAWHLTDEGRRVERSVLDHVPARP